MYRLSLHSRGFYRESGERELWLTMDTCRQLYKKNEEENEKMKNNE